MIVTEMSPMIILPLQRSRIKTKSFSHDFASMGMCA